MNNIELLKNIEYYIKSKECSYAIMLDGEWGTGKTYFYKSNIEKLIRENDLKPIYISLFGIENIDNLKENIFDEIVKNIKPNRAKSNSQYSVNVAENENATKTKVILFLEKIYSIIFKDTRLIRSISKEYLRNFKNINITGNYINYMVDVILNDSYFMVVDDFERTKIDTIELLGFLNNYIEHSKIKILIISNQNEIRSYKKYENIELKYLVVQNQKRLSCIDNKKQNNYNANDLNNDVDETFDYNNLYKQINEKVVGKVFEYKPDLKSVIEELIKNYDSEYIDLLDKENATNFVLEVFKDEEHYNIRTFKLILDYYDKYVKNIFENNTELNKQYVLAVFRCIVKCGVLYKKYGDILLNDKGELLIKKGKNLTYSLRKSTDYETKIFYSVVEFIKTNNFNNRRVINEYKAHLKIIDNKKDYSDFWEIQKLFEYWESKNDYELKELIINIDKIIINKLENEEFSIYSALIVLRYLYDFKYRVGMDINYLENLEETIAKQINSSKEERMEINDSFSFILFNNCCDEFENKRNEISSLIEKRNIEIKKISIMDKYSHENYGESFLGDVETILYSRYLSDSKVINIIDLKRFNRFILMGDNDNLVKFKQGVYKMHITYGLMHNSDFYDGVIELFKEVHEQCEEKVKKYLLKYFINELEGVRTQVK